MFTCPLHGSFAPNTNKTNMFFQGSIQAMPPALQMDKMPLQVIRPFCLIDVPKEVSLIHVPGWGRIAIPICIDFLHPEYRDWLVTTLKADILLCPSYSPGEYNFLQSLDSNAGYGAHVVWLNSCSALRNSDTGAPELVGAACAPSVSSESRIIRFIPECKGDCTTGCLFVATIPLNCMGASFYEERRVQVEHIRTPKEM